MKNTSYLITGILCLAASFLIAQCDVDLFITNASASGDKYTFDIEMRSNIGDLLLADSDFNIIDADGETNISGGVSINGLPGTEASGGGTSYIVNFSAPPAFSPTIGNQVTKIGTITLDGYKDGSVQLEWNGAIINYYDTNDGNQQKIITNLCYFIAPDQVLPVELTYFTARMMGDRSVKLDWETAVEAQNAGFEIQHSLDGNNWGVLGFVKGKGTTQISQTYQFIHLKAPVGINYYRLKQLDVDGAFEYSNIESIKIEGGVAEFVVYPNPATDLVNILVNEEAGQRTLQLKDQLGRTVATYTMDQFTNRKALQLGHFTRGVYYLILSLGDNKYTKKLVLQE